MYKTTKRLKKMKTKRKIKKIKTKKCGGNLFSLRHARTFLKMARPEDIEKNKLSKILKPLKEDIIKLLNVVRQVLVPMTEIQMLNKDYDLPKLSSVLDAQLKRLEEICKALEFKEIKKIDINNFEYVIRKLLQIIDDLIGSGVELKGGIYDRIRDELMSYTDDLKNSINEKNKLIESNEEFDEEYESKKLLSEQIKIMEGTIETICPEPKFLKNGRPQVQFSLIDDTIPDNVEALKQIQQNIIGYNKTMINAIGYANMMRQGQESTADL